MFLLWKKAYSLLKKVIIVFLVYAFIITLFTIFFSGDKKNQQVAQYDPIQAQRKEIYSIINDANLNKTTDGKLSIYVYRSVLCSLVGEGCTEKPEDGDKNFSKSLFGFAANLIVAPVVNPPASGVYWAYSGLSNAGFIPKSYAAEGIGFAGLKPLMNVWKVFRDIAYMVMVIVIVALGFMIMFRMKLDAQTVISVESALPRIVVSLILITLSFPLAGFLIDLMYVIIAVIISLLGNNQYFDIGREKNLYLNASPFVLFGGLFPTGVGNLFEVAKSLLDMLPGILNGGIRLISAVGAIFLARNIHELATKPIPEGASNISILGNTIGKIPVWLNLPIAAIIFVMSLSFLPQLLILFIMVFTILFLFFRIFFMLFRAYLQILILTIFAPIFLLFVAIPGKNAFGFWFKTLLMEIMTFPIVIALIITGYIIINQIAAKEGLWNPPFLYGINPQAFTILVGMGMILIIPEIVKMVKELMGVKGLPAGLSLGAFFAGGGVGVGSTMGIMQQYSSLAYTAHYLPGPFKKIIGKIPGFGDSVKAMDEAKVVGKPIETGQRG
ncbi:hypothetical protein HY358_00515 [Candidatus Roizmanbacteria bacterium]|nr:hypothetical protein [Candidatus Roizmanbacteria bacterium]